VKVPAAVTVANASIQNKSNLIWLYEDLALRRTYIYIRKINGVTQTFDIISANTIEIIFDHVLDDRELFHISQCTLHSIDVIAYQMQSKNEVVHLNLINAISTTIPTPYEDDRGYLIICSFASESPVQNKLVLGARTGKK